MCFLLRQYICCVPVFLTVMSPAFWSWRRWRVIVGHLNESFSTIFPAFILSPLASSTVSIYRLVGWAKALKTLSNSFSSLAALLSVVNCHWFGTSNLAILLNKEIFFLLGQ